MSRDDGLPLIPSASSVADLPLPDVLVDPRLPAAEQAALEHAAREALACSSRFGDYVLRRPDDPSDLRTAGFGVLALWSMAVPVWWLAEPYLPYVLAAAALVTLVVGGIVGHRLVELRHRRDDLRRFDQARRDGLLIVPAQDLDAAGQIMLRAVSGAVTDVAASRALREGRLADGPELLADQRWRVAGALVQLTQARLLVRRTGGRLEEHRRALRATERAVEDRVRAILSYAESVRRVDATLADIDAATYTDTLDHKLRDTLAALGEDATLASLESQSHDAQEAVGAALRVLRRQTETLRSLTDSAGDA